MWNGFAYPSIAFGSVSGIQIRNHTTHAHGLAFRRNQAVPQPKRTQTAGVGRTVVIKLTRHKTFSMSNRVNTVDQENTVGAMWKLDSFLWGQKTEKCSDGLLSSKKKGLYRVPNRLNLLVPRAGIEPARGVNPEGF